jgi:hypothetical protein
LNLRVLQPPVGLESLNGQRKFDAWQSFIHKRNTESIDIGTYLLEVRTSGENLMYEVLNREDIILSKRRLDDTVVGQGNALLVDLAITALVNKLANGF